MNDLESNLISHLERSLASPLDEAHALPFQAYTSKAVYRLEQQKVFREDWVFACVETALAKPGDYFAFQLVGEPVVVLRGTDGELRALSNVCRHRGTLLLEEGFGQCDKAIVCPYHAWAYDHGGKLKAAPLPGDQNIDKASHCLPVFKLETWLGLVFINLSGTAQPLANRYQSMEPYLQAMQPERFTEAFNGEEEHWQANWKLAMENAMESYHLFKVHKDTLETVTPTRQSYYIAGSSEWTLTGGGGAQQSPGFFEKLLGANEDELHSHYILVSLPPSFVGIISYDNIGWLSVHPQSASDCIIRSGYQVEPGVGRQGKQEKSFVDAFFAEDKWICERVQKGMGAHYGKGGKLVDMERVVVDFRNYLAVRMFGHASTTTFSGEGAERWLTGAS